MALATGRRQQWRWVLGQAITETKAIAVLPPRARRDPTLTAEPHALDCLLSG